MEHESLDYKIVMDGGPDTEVLARLASLELAGPALHGGDRQVPSRNIALRRGAQVIKRHDGKPKPEPPILARDPSLKSWSAHLIGGKKMQLLGFVDAATEAAAIEAAVALFGLDDIKRKRLAVNLRR
jgi:hypothetical protein